MTRIDMRSGAWRKMREARERIEILRASAHDSADYAQKHGDRGAEAWWNANAEGLGAASDVLWAIMQAARKGKRKR